MNWYRKCFGDIRALTDRTTRFELIFGSVTNSHNFQVKNNLPAAKRIIAIDRQCLVIYPRDNEALRLAFFILGVKRGANFPLLFGNVFEAIRKHQ